MTQRVADTRAGARLISDGDRMSDTGESRSGRCPQFVDQRGQICGPEVTAVRPASTGISQAPGALCGS